MSSAPCSSSLFSSLILSSLSFSSLFSHFFLFLSVATTVIGLPKDGIGRLAPMSDGISDGFLPGFKVSPPCADAEVIFPCQCANTSTGVVTLSCDGVTVESVARRALHAPGYGANPLDTFNMRWGTVSSMAADFFGELSFSHVLLHQNRLSSVEPGSLEGLKSDLITLNLNSNQLTELIITQLMGFSKLTTLSQSGNLINDLTPLTDLPDTLPSVRNLELAGNLITTLPAGAFRSVPMVRVIDLSYNNISFIHAEVFLDLVNLEELILDGNHLNLLGSPEVGKVVLPRAISLLSLEESNIEVLEPGFVEGLGDRSTLSLSRNPILHFTEEVFGDVLRNLTVSDIPIETGLKFWYNFIDCGCDILWLAENRWLNVHVYGAFCAPRSEDWKEWTSIHRILPEDLEGSCPLGSTYEPPGPART